MLDFQKYTWGHSRTETWIGTQSWTLRDEKKNRKSKLFFPYHLISKKELGASQTQVSKITSKMLEHQIEVFDEKHQPKQNETMQSG